VPKPPHPTLVAIGRRIRQQRTRQKWSQERLADEARIDRSYMSGIERGVRNTSVLTLLRIAKALDVSLVALIDSERS
jgi:transcriptional regulator with XRE-family HTH domain